MTVFYKPLVIDSQSRTFEDETYINTIGSKVVIKPVGEIMELFMKKEKTLQRTMASPQVEKASSSKDATGYLPSGEILGAPTTESTEVLPSGKISVEEVKHEDVEMNAAQDEEETPQGEQMQDVEEVDYGESEEEPVEQVLHFELERIDAELQKDEERRQETHQQQREAEGRQEQQQEMQEEETAVPSSEDEVKGYQEELETRKKIDIFAQPSSAESLRLLKHETESFTTAAQVKMEIFSEQGTKKSNKPFQSKMPISLDRPLESEPRVKVSVPKPEPGGEEQDMIEHESPLDGLMVLDKENQSKTFGFYGKSFRYDHNSALNCFEISNCRTSATSLC